MKANNFLVLATLPLALLACGKDDNPDPGFYEATACFELLDQVVYTDSMIVFNNCSDSVNVNYQWDFGDGSSSQERQARHIYSKSGNYEITLTTLVNQHSTDSATMTVKVLTGEKYYAYASHTSALDFVELPDETIFVIGKTRSGPQFSYFMAKYDSELREMWVKNLNKDSVPNFGSADMTADGNIILTSSIDQLNEIQSFSLSKIDTSGSVLWTKSYPQTNGYNKLVTRTMDGGFITIGTENYSYPPWVFEVASVLKVGANGEFEWQRFFGDELILNAGNVVATADGYFFAGSARTGQCLNCQDQLVLRKLSLSGDVVWTTAISRQALLPTGHANLVAYNGSTIVVVNEYNNEYIIFNAQGEYLHTQTGNVHGKKFISPTAEGGFIIGGGFREWNPNQVDMLDAQGQIAWQKIFGNRSDACEPWQGYGSQAKAIESGNILLFGLSYDWCSQHESGSLYMLKINENGEVQ